MRLSPKRYLSLVAAPLLLGACTSLSPIGEDEFRCEAAANGGVCASPSTVLLGGPTGSVDPNAETGDSVAAGGSPLRLASGNPRATAATPAPPPVDSATIAPARVLRIWVAPHESDGALVVSGYVYGEIEPRSWNVGFAGDNDRTGRTFQPLRANAVGR